MKYECPSCYLQWKDDKEPMDNIFHPLCAFCSIRHSQKELLNWQMNHIDDINPAKLTHVLRHFYRFVELQLKLIEEKIHDSDPPTTSYDGKS